MNRLLVTATAAVACSLAVLPCQSTLTVGAGGYVDVNAALAAASPGDTIVVLPGTYPWCSMNKGVTVRAATPGTVTIGQPLIGVIGTIPAGQTAHLVSLQLGSVQLGGRLTVDDCQLSGKLALTDGVAVIQGCTLQLPANQVGAATIEAQQTDLTAVDCSVYGMTNAAFPPLWRPVIALVDSRLRGSRLLVQGAPGITMPAISADAASSMWLSECTISAVGACAITGGTGRHDRCTLTPPCSSIPNGFVLGAHRVAPLQNGAPFAVEYTLQPGMAVGVFGASTFASQTYPELEQSLLLPVASAFPLAALVADAQGRAGGTWAVPAGPQFVDRTLWLQGFSGFALPLQASPIVGGVVR
jgi:hypothetical protein